MRRTTGPSLVLPFAFLGLVGGWAAADVHGLQVGHFETAARVLLCVMTPVVAGYLGATASRRASDGPITHALGFCLAGAIAGVVNGTLVGLFVVPPWGALFGAVWGGLWSLPFLPVLGLVVGSSRRCAAARPRSLLRRVHGRGVWVTTLLAASIALGAPLVVRASPPGRPSVAVAVAVVAAAVAGIAALTLRDVAVLAALREPRGEGWRMRDEGDPVPEGAEVADLGAGDEVWERVAPATAPYRAAARVERLLRGSVHETRRALRRVVLKRLLALGVASAVLVAYVDRAPAAEDWAQHAEGWD